MTNTKVTITVQGNELKRNELVYLFTASTIIRLRSRCYFYPPEKKAFAGRTRDSVYEIRWSTAYDIIMNNNFFYNDIVYIRKFAKKLIESYAVKESL